MGYELAGINGKIIEGEIELWRNTSKDDKDDSSKYRISYGNVTVLNK